MLKKKTEETSSHSNERSLRVSVSCSTSSLFLQKPFRRRQQLHIRLSGVSSELKKEGKGGDKMITYN
jgi:hypothetical protein